MKKSIRITESDLHRIIKESIKKHLTTEAFSGIVQYHNFRDINKDYYNGYVIVDGTRAVLGQYDDYYEAVEDAKILASNNKYGTYEVYGCDKDGYALEEDYPEDNTLVYSTDSENHLNEAYSDAQYAHLAGQSFGALNSFGGKLKGFVNPKWKRRKTRQLNRFATQATTQATTAFGDNSRVKNSENNGGSQKADYLGYSGKGPIYNYISNNFNRNNKKTPYEIKRNSFYKRFGDDRIHSLNNDGDVLSQQDVINKSNEYYNDKLYDKSQQFDNVVDSNRMLNNAFNDGINSVKRKGQTQKTLGGNFKYDTGTKGENFKKWK